MKRVSGIAGRGALAGFCSAAAIAIWFLVIDLVQNAPFHTPLFVARTLLNLQTAEASFTVLAIYTVLHFAAFIAVGILTAWLLEKAGLPPIFLLGLVLGFVLFDLIFYAGILITGTNVVRELGWPEVLVGNMIAGLILVGVLSALSPGEKVRLRDVLRDHRTMREGIIAGALGAVAVMLWFLVIDVISGRALFTPAALGSAIFAGARGMAQVQMSMEIILAYTGAHVIAFLFVGLLASAMVEGARREPHLLLALVLLFVVLEVIFLGVIAMIAAWLLDAIRWWMIVVANLIAAAVMAGYLLYMHPEMRENITRDLEEELAQ